MQQAATALCLALVLAVAGPQPAAAWLSDEALEQSCHAFLADPADEAGAYCLAYVQGYLTGADSSATPGYTREAAESFADRATRKRLGTLRMQRLEADAALTWCVDPSMPAVEVVRRVLTHLEAQEGLATLTDAEAVRAALAANFPCEEPGS